MEPSGRKMRVVVQSEDRRVEIGGPEAVTGTDLVEDFLKPALLAMGYQPETVRDVWEDA